SPARSARLGSAAARARGAPWTRPDTPAPPPIPPRPATQLRRPRTGRRPRPPPIPMAPTEPSTSEPRVPLMAVDVNTTEGAPAVQDVAVALWTTGPGSGELRTEHLPS